MKLKKKYEIKFDTNDVCLNSYKFSLNLYKNKAIFISKSDLMDSIDRNFNVDQIIVIYDLDSKSVVYSVFLFYEYSIEILDNIIHLYGSYYQDTNDATLNLDTLEYVTLDKKSETEYIKEEEERNRYNNRFYTFENNCFTTFDKKETVQVENDFIQILDTETKVVLRKFENQKSEYLKEYKYQPLKNLCGCVSKDKKYLAISTLSNADIYQDDLNAMFPYYGDGDKRNSVGYNRDLIMLMYFETLKPIKFFGRDFKYFWQKCGFDFLNESVNKIEISENNKYVVAGDTGDYICDPTILIFDILEPHNKGILPYYTLGALFVTKGDNEILCILQNEKQSELYLTCFEIISETEEDVKKRNNNIELICIT